MNCDLLIVELTNMNIEFIMITNMKAQILSIGNDVKVSFYNYYL